MINDSLTRLTSVTSTVSGSVSKSKDTEEFDPGRDVKMKKLFLDFAADIFCTCSLFLKFFVAEYIC